MRKEYVKNILSKKIVIIIFYLIGFLLLVLNFSTNWINGGKTQNIGGFSFSKFQSDSEYLVTSEIFNDKYSLTENKYGLSRITNSSDEWLNSMYINDRINYDKDLNDLRVQDYVSQVGLQGHVFSFLYNKLHISIRVIKLILTSLLAITLLYICKYISIKFNKKLAIIFFMVFLLSPWICAFARNLYWVEFTWFIPMLLGLILSTNYNRKKVVVPFIFLSVFIKCLCGYEYITVIMLSMIMFMLYDFIFEKDKKKRKEIFKTIFIVGVVALIGFVSAILIHSYLRGNGSIYQGIINIYKQDVVRRTISSGDISGFSNVIVQSIQASPLSTLNKYFYWSTDIITGITGSNFKLIFVYSILIIIFNLIIRKKNALKDLILYLLLFVTCISWFILSSPHSYIHTHMNYVLWYFGFIQFELYLIIDFIIYIFSLFNGDNNKQEYIISKEVPKYDKNEYKYKKNKYCLCIPIINEGERILKELEIAKKNNIDKLVDIIICDGGSTDSSTNDTKLKKLGVNTLLVKKDDGKQGAQLRMGFSYALERGYDGIITIDGNNKDSIEDVPKFIQKLDDGYDFVQGSRFIKGGKAINTPFIRNISVRLLHAPVISLTAGEKFTDTTNAYRAYSKKYLSHPKVQPFRKVFDTYELLAYLSVRASQLGLKTCEIPVRREYPKKGKTPTKISPIKGNYILLKILFKNAFGVFDPVGGENDEI